MKNIFVFSLGLFAGLTFSVCAMEEITQEQHELNKAFIETVKKK